MLPCLLPRHAQTLKNRLASVDPNGNTTQLDLVRQENAVLRADLAAKDEVLQELTDKVSLIMHDAMMSSSRYAWPTHAGHASAAVFLEPYFCSRS